MAYEGYRRGLTEEGKSAARKIGEWAEEREKMLSSLSPKSPDGLPSKYDKEATRDLGGGRVRVFRTDTGFFFEGKDVYIKEEDIARFAPKLLEKLKVLA